MNFKKLIEQSCAKCQYAHLLCLKKFGIKFRFFLACDYMALCHPLKFLKINILNYQFQFGKRDAQVNSFEFLSNKLQSILENVVVNLQ